MLDFKPSFQWRIFQRIGADTLAQAITCPFQKYATILTKKQSCHRNLDLQGPPSFAWDGLLQHAWGDRFRRIYQNHRSLLSPC